MGSPMSAGWPIWYINLRSRHSWGRSSRERPLLFLHTRRRNGSSEVKAPAASKLREATPGHNVYVEVMNIAASGGAKPPGGIKAPRSNPGAQCLCGGYEHRRIRRSETPRRHQRSAKQPRGTMSMWRL